MFLFESFHYFVISRDLKRAVNSRNAHIQMKVKHKVAIHPHRVCKLPNKFTYTNYVGEKFVTEDNHHIIKDIKGQGIEFYFDKIS